MFDPNDIPDVLLGQGVVVRNQDPDDPPEEENGEGVDRDPDDPPEEENGEGIDRDPDDPPDGDAGMIYMFIIKIKKTNNLFKTFLLNDKLSFPDKLYFPDKLHF